MTSILPRFAPMRLLTAGGILSLGILAGCGKTVAPNAPQLGVITHKALSTSVQRLTHDIRVDEAGRISSVEARSVQDFLTAIRAGYGDDISVENPRDLAGVRDALVPVIGRFGLSLTGAAAPTGAALQPGTVRLVVSRSLVQLPACPDWSNGSNPNFANASLSNFGCANRTNLGLMVADPADLERGRALDGVDAATITRGITWQRDYKSKGFEGMPSGAATTSSGGGGEEGGGGGGN